jgi:chorismate dehydratase
MMPVRLGAVGYLNARPLVYGLDVSPRFEVRFDVPSRCAALLHDHTIDVGLIPSIEYLRAPAGVEYDIVPDLAIASRGEVASVALYTTRPIADVRSIALDTSSRTSAALVRVLCARLFHIEPEFHPHGPDLSAMLLNSDAALLIGDNALLVDPQHAGAAGEPVEKIDLGDAWTRLTGLPFVWAFWAGRPGRLSPADISALTAARDAGVERPDEIARDYFPNSRAYQRIGSHYLRDNIKYYLGSDERRGLELFFEYSAGIGTVAGRGALRFSS